MRRQLHAEWTKLRTTSGAGWIVVAIVVLTAALSILASSSVDCPAAGCGYDAAKVSLLGVQLGQAVVAGLAVMMVGGEYRNSMIRTTLIAMPRRWTVLAAKAAVVAAVTFVAGTVAVLVSVLAGRVILPGSGFTSAHGYPPLSLADGPMLRAAAGSVLYLVLIALLSLGIAMAVRGAGVAIGAVLGLFYLFPFLMRLTSSRELRVLLFQISPTDAGLSIQATANLDSLPIGPWAGMGVLVLWVVAAMLGGGLLLRSRDAA